MSETISVRSALYQAMEECMIEDEKVFIIGEEVAQYQGAYKVTQGLLEKFGSKRVIDSPITEQGFAGLAIGAAFNGLRPIVEFMTFNFSMQAIDQIINSAAKTCYMSGGDIKCPIVFRGPNGSAARVAAQHSQCFASWYAHCPGLKVVAPYDANHTKALLKEAIKDNSPVIFLEHEITYGMQFPIVPTDIKIGQSLVTKEGSDVTIVGFSYMMSKIYEAHEILLSQHNINAEVIDLLTLRPLDKQTIINSVIKTNKVVVVEEGWPYAGIASEISCVINEEAFDYLDNSVIRVTGEDVPLPYAANLEKAALPTVEKIVDAVLKVCYKN